MYKNSHKNFAKSRGFSLIELIVAIVVLSLGLTGVLLAFNYAVRGSADPVLHKQALSIAEEKIAECRMLNFDDAAAQCKGVKLDKYADDTDITDATVTIETNSKEVCQNVGTNCYPGAEIKVTVTPNGNSNHSVVLYAYRTDWVLPH